MSDNKEILLRAKNISIVFGGLRAVSDFNLELKEGELIGLIGPNGAGKTTVFNMLSGVYKPTSGTITFVGRDGNLQVISGKSPAQLNRVGIARTFQNIRLFGNLTVGENIKIALHQNRNVNPIDVLLRTPRFRKDEKKMQEKTKILEQFPESGAIPRDRVLKSNGYRFLVYKDYLLFYLYEKEANTAYVMAIFNGKRDYMRVMKKFL